MLKRHQAIELANKYELLSSDEYLERVEYSQYDEDIISALIEASRGDFHLTPIGQANKSRVEPMMVCKV